MSDTTSNLDSGYTLKLTLDPKAEKAGGKITATSEVVMDDGTSRKISVVMQILDSSGEPSTTATFANSLTNTVEGSTNPLGFFSREVTDATPGKGYVLAYLPQDESVKKIESFTFKKVDNYEITLSIDLNGQPADGVAKNKATATVTDQNGPVIDGTFVTFTLPATEFAYFTDMSKIRTLPTTDGKVAIEFMDVYPKGESGALNALAMGVSDSKPYYFSAAPVYEYMITLSPDVDGQPADGISQNSATVTITYKNRLVDDGTKVFFSLPESQYASFTTLQGHVKMVTVPTQKGKASVSFSDSFPDGEQVSLDVLCGGANQAHEFTFSPAPVYKNDIDLEAEYDRAPADGVSANWAIATVTMAGKPVNDGTPVLFTLPPEQYATFLDGSVRQLQSTSGGKARIAFVDSYQAGEVVPLNALSGGKDEARDFTFDPAPVYNVDLDIRKDQDHAKADGVSKNSATTKVTFRNAAVADGTTVVYTLPTDQFATFAGGAKRTEVKTFNGEASVAFSDSYRPGELVELRAQCLGGNKYEKFTFDEAVDYGYSIEVDPVLDGQPADGASENTAIARVSYKGAAAPDNTEVLFSLPATKSAYFSDTLSRTTLLKTSGGQALVKFVDNYLPGEIVSLNAQSNGADNSRQFYFIPATKYAYQIHPEMERNNQIADGKAADICAARVTKNGAAVANNSQVVFSLDPDSSSFFVGGKKVVEVLTTSGLARAKVFNNSGVDTVETLTVSAFGQTAFTKVVFANNNPSTYIFYRSQERPNNISWVRKSDSGVSWSAPVALTDINVGNGAHVSFFYKGKIYLIYIDAGSRVVYIRNFDGESWSARYPVNISQASQFKYISMVQNASVSTSNVSLFAVSADNKTCVLNIYNFDSADNIGSISGSGAAANGYWYCASSYQWKSWDDGSRNKASFTLSATYLHDMAASCIATDQSSSKTATFGNPAWQRSSSETTSIPLGSGTVLFRSPVVGPIGAVKDYIFHDGAKGEVYVTTITVSNVKAVLTPYPIAAVYGLKSLFGVSGLAYKGQPAVICSSQDNKLCIATISLADQSVLEIEPTGIAIASSYVATAYGYFGNE